MRKTVLVVALSVLLPLAALAQTNSTAEPPQVSAETPIKSELDKIFSSLQSQLKDVDKLAAHLKATANRKAEDTQQQINGAADTLSALTDRLQPTGDLTSQLTALRNAAALHRKRIQEMPKEAIEEADRTTLMKAWDKAIVEADKTAASMGDMRDRLTHVLKKLRMRQAAAGEYLLAGQYQAAVASLRAWVGELEATVNSLHQAIDPAKPST